MSYQVLARKYRPMKFDEVVGQEAIVRTLRNAILQDRLAHAYLLAGPRGVGKTSVARILAKSLNCPNREKTDPCNRCETCERISQGEDIDVLEIDGASNNGVEEVRSLREAARYAPSHSPHKVYIIDEVHMLSTAAFNALLKTLEEPPAHVLFFFATTDPQRLPATIHSRCQRFNFRRIRVEEIAAALGETCHREGAEVEEAALWTIARRAGGSLRDALSLLDQSLAYSAGEVTETTVREMLGLLDAGEILRLLVQVREGEAADALRSLDRLLREGADISDLLSQMIEVLRDLLVLKVSPASTGLIQRSPEETESLAEEAGPFSIDTLLHYLAVLQEARGKIRLDSIPRIRVEVVLVELARLPDLESIDEIAGRLTSGSIPAAETVRDRPMGSAGGGSGAGGGGASPSGATADAAPGQTVPAGIWEGAVKKIREERPALGGMLDLLRPVSLADGILTVGCPGGSRGMADRVLGDRSRKKGVEEVLGGMGVGPVRLRIVTLPDEPSGESPQDHPWVKAAREILGEAPGVGKEEG